MTELATVIDAHDWSALPALLHDDFVCRYVHTGEQFDRLSWVQLNRDYPGFDRFVLQDCIGNEVRAAGRSHVTSNAGATTAHYEVATFLTVRAELITEMVELWTDVDLTTMPYTRAS